MHPLPRMPPGAAGPEEYSEHERRNLAAAEEYMEIAYDAKRASADAVRHLVAEGAVFEAHSTFPAVHDPLAYAQHHAGACAAGKHSSQRGVRPWTVRRQTRADEPHAAWRQTTS
jgi:hypothetical protein